MSKLLQLRLGVSDDPTVRQPTLADCLGHVAAQCEVLADHVVEGLVQASAPSGPRRHPALQAPGMRAVVDALVADLPALRADFRGELERLLYQGGGSDAEALDLLRFEDLQLLGDADLDRSIELARAQQEVARMVDDVLPRLDALVSTLLGWRSIQPGLNPLRPEVFIRALQSVLWARVPDGPARDALILPAAGLLGAQLRRVYRELGDWLASTGVDPAVPAAGRRDASGPAAASGSPVSRSLARTLLTLDRLRKLLAGDFDAGQAGPGEFLHTVPASMALLQDLQQEDQLLQRLQDERAARGTGGPQDLLATQGRAAVARIGQALGEQVVRLMFDNLVQDGRLVAAYKQQLRALEPSVLALAREDSRFFSDRLHPGRRLLEAMTQRSLAFSVESDEGWTLFLAGIESAAARLAGQPALAEHFQAELERLQAAWDAHDAAARQRREEAARALVHAEQRNLLAQRFAAEFRDAAAHAGAPEFVVDFLRHAWAQAVAESKLGCQDGSDDPQGRHALVADLLWSVRQGPVRRARQHRLAQLVPGLISRLREGLQSIGYPPELTARFLDRLAAIHAAALREGRDAAARSAADDALSAPSEFSPDAAEDPGVWIGQDEAQDCSYLGADSVLPGTAAEPQGALPAVGSWVELQVDGRWHRVQLTWASPHRTLFMFTSPRRTAHSVSLRTLRRLQAAGQVRLVAGSNLVEDALDEVARAALRNSLDEGGPPS